MRRYDYRSHYETSIPSEGEFRLPRPHNNPKPPEKGAKVYLSMSTSALGKRRLKSARFVRVEVNTTSPSSIDWTEAWIFVRGEASQKLAESLR